MRYWVYLNGEVPGSFTPEDLAIQPGFSMTALVCPASGDIADKNWRRAGEFSDIAGAISARQSAADAPAMPPAPPLDVNALIDTTSSKLFGHVSDLMSKLESHREEKALVISLQRQLAAAREELTRARERADLLEVRLPRIAELEETLRHAREALEVTQIAAQTSAAERDTARAETRVASDALQRLKNEFDVAQRRLQELTLELSGRQQRLDQMTVELNAKELSLSKALGVITRLERELQQLNPAPPVVSVVEASPLPANPASPDEHPTLMGSAMGYLKKIFPG